MAADTADTLGFDGEAASQCWQADREPITEPSMPPQGEAGAETSPQEPPATNGEASNNENKPARCLEPEGSESLPTPVPVPSGSEQAAGQQVVASPMEEKTSEDQRTPSGSADAKEDDSMSVPEGQKQFCEPHMPGGNGAEDDRDSQVSSGWMGKAINYYRRCEEQEAEKALPEQAVEAVIESPEKPKEETKPSELSSASPMDLLGTNPPLVLRKSQLGYVDGGEEGLEGDGGENGAKQTQKKQKQPIPSVEADGAAEEKPPKRRKKRSQPQEVAEQAQAREGTRVCPFILYTSTLSYRLIEFYCGIMLHPSRHAGSGARGADPRGGGHG